MIICQIHLCVRRKDKLLCFKTHRHSFPHISCVPKLICLLVCLGNSMCNEHVVLVLCQSSCFEKLLYFLLVEPGSCPNQQRNETRRWLHLVLQVSHYSCPVARSVLRAPLTVIRDDKFISVKTEKPKCLVASECLVAKMSKNQQNKTKTKTKNKKQKRKQEDKHGSQNLVSLGYVFGQERSSDKKVVVLSYLPVFFPRVIDAQKTDRFPPGLSSQEVSKDTVCVDIQRCVCVREVESNGQVVGKLSADAHVLPTVIHLEQEWLQLQREIRR